MNHSRIAKCWTIDTLGFLILMIGQRTCFCQCSRILARLFAQPIHFFINFDLLFYKRFDIVNIMRWHGCRGIYVDVTRAIYSFHLSLCLHRLNQKFRGASLLGSSTLWHPAYICNLVCCSITWESIYSLSTTQTTLLDQVYFWSQ